jgi:hypothetical protein|nr:MAG TPA: hypothetical protein [Caudoviricetes sp.]
MMDIYQWVKNIKLEAIFIGLWSIFVSVLIQSLCSITHVYILPQYTFSNPLRLLIYFFLAAFLSMLYVKLTSSKIFSELIFKQTNKSINSDIFDDLFDYATPMLLRIYVKNSNILYIGKLCIREEKGMDSWISLVDYGVIDKLTNEVIYDPQSNNERTAAIVNLRDVERIETIYQNNSKLWDSLHPYDVKE